MRISLDVKWFIPNQTIEEDSKISVYGHQRSHTYEAVPIPEALATNTRLQMDGLALLSQLPVGCAHTAFFDPQYRGILNKMAYGNEGKARTKARSELQQMSKTVIQEFIAGIAAALVPSGHLFLWVDKFHLCQGIKDWVEGIELQIVDLLTWKKGRIGMGYRTRRIGEHVVILQKKPIRAKGVWVSHNIADVWEEPVPMQRVHIHQKPLLLQMALIEATTPTKGVVLDPAAGSFSVMKACQEMDRVFLGCDIREIAGPSDDNLSIP